MLVVSPFGGVLADRLDRRFLIVSTQVSQLVLTAPWPSSSSPRW